MSTDSPETPSESRAAAIARTQRAVDSIRTLGQQLQQLRAQEPTYGLDVRRSSPQDEGILGQLHIQGSLTHDCAGSARHINVPGQVVLVSTYFRERTSADDRRAETTRKVLSEPLTGEVLRDTTHARAEPLIEIFGRLGGCYRAYGGGILGGGLPQANAQGAWAEAVYSRCTPDELWLHEAGTWKRIPVVETPPVPHCFVYWDAAAASAQTVKALVAEAEDNLRRRHGSCDLVRLEILGKRQGGRWLIVLNGETLSLSDGHYAVVKTLAYHHNARPGEPAPLPEGAQARRNFQTRLSDLRSSNARIQRGLKAALAALPAPLIHATEPRFNPEFEMDVTLP